MCLVRILDKQPLLYDMLNLYYTSIIKEDTFWVINRGDANLQNIRLHNIIN